jgi:hypothetical protein
MVTTGDCSAIGSFDEFAAPLLQQRAGESRSQSNARALCLTAAMLAWSDGACDQLVAAALAHNLASIVEPDTTDNGGPARSARLLFGIFPSTVIAWLQEVDATAVLTGRVVASPGARTHVSRLRRYIEAARDVRQQKCMPVELLVAAARRASLDD